MTRLRDGRLWLRIPEAASYLGTTTGEHHDEADVLRAALDGQIQLSVDLPTPIPGNRISEVPTSSSTAPQERISGLFDLVLEGNGRLLIENMWRTEKRLPKVPMIVGTDIGVCVVSEQGQKYQFPPSYAPLPREGIVVVKRTWLDAAIHQISTNNQPASVPPKALVSREKKTFVVIIAALAEEARIDISHPSKAALAIEKGMSRALLKLSGSLVHDYATML